MLTDRYIRNLKEKGSDFRTYDKSTEEYRGFHIKVSAKGVKSFAIAYRDFGKQQFFVIGQYPTFSLAQAREECRKARQLIEKGIDPKEEKQRQIASEENERLQREQKEAIERSSATFNDLAELYYEKLINDNTREQCQYMLRYDALPLLKNKRLSDITTEDIKKVLRRPYKRGSKASHHQLYLYLHSMFELATNVHNDSTVDTEVIWPIIDNPVSPIKKPEKSLPRQRFLGEDEIGAVWEAGHNSKVSPQIIRTLLLLIATGQRVREVTEMEWREIDFKNSLWVIPPERIKTGKKRPEPHAVPLTALTRKILSEAPHLHKRYAFPHSAKDEPMPWRSVGQAVRRLAADAEIEPFQTKDLRRTVKTHMARLRIAKPIRDMIQNHSLHDISSIHYDMWDGLPEKIEALRKWNIELIKLLKARNG